MKKLLGLSILGLLLTGCSLERDHNITCIDSKTGSLSVYKMTPGNIFAMVVNGHSVLAYRDNNGKIQVIFLRENNCEIY